MTVDPRSRITGRALTVWAAAVLVYLAAITGRTSFGVAGVEALDRFGVDASRLAVFTAVQVGVYALAQIPVGLAIDRFGARRTMVIGALVMAVGQITLALTASYPIAILGRVLIGAGDASAFLSAMRLLPAWFPLKVTPLFTQLTAGLGQIGQFVSAVPFLMLLHAEGWTAAFLALGSGIALVGIAAAVAIADVPKAPAEPGENAGASSSHKPDDRATVREMLGIVLRHPVCWQGFFTHWVGLMHQATFTLLWGMPLMTLAMGLTPAQAGGVLVVNTVASVAAGPLMGMASSRFGARRGTLTVVISVILMGMWVVFLIPGTPRGLAAIVALNIAMAALSSASGLGFDSVREAVDRRALATGTGLSNMGGFLAAMMAAQGIGLLLDASSDGRAYQWADFRVAWIAIVVVWVMGMAGLITAMIARRRIERREPTSGTRLRHP
ncbi:MFS transporter permease [Corynebacterium xerosis]|uniref:MFS transporter n=1 Tax=Corynebacterium xerosis TaxID=1725 RepID=UPI0006274A3B|nr:MFS transporter [Corynebacterium xerosis]KKO82691.1 MFS transporter permease [Corynebacterium xerosis]SQB96782.1 permease [Clostridium paraputrificum]